MAEAQETMKLGRVVTLVLGAAVLGASMQAQEPERKPRASGPASEMAKPAPEMEKRKWVVGKWNVTETHEKRDASPGGIGKGTSVIDLGPGGHSQIITYNSMAPTGKFSGHGIIAWDAEAKIFRSAWADSMTRSRSIAPNPAGWTEVTEMSTDGGPFIKMRTFEFTRAK